MLDNHVRQVRLLVLAKAIMRCVVLLVQTLRLVFGRINKASTRVAIALLLVSLVVSVVHRIVPSPLSGVHSTPVNGIYLRRPALNAHRPGFGLGGAYVPTVTPTLGPQPQPTPAPTQPAPQPTQDNPLGWFFSFITGQATPDSKTVAQGLLAIIIAFCTLLFGQTVTDLLISFASQSSFLWITPPEMTYNNASLGTIWTGMLSVSLGLFVLVMMWNGIMLMWRRSSFDYAAAIETIPRAILAFFLAAFSKNLIELLVSLNNALCNDLARPDLFHVLNTTNADLIFVLVLTVYGFMGVLLLIANTLRLALLGIEIALAPVCCMCLGTKITEPIGRLWISATTATVFVQFLQALTLTVGIKYLIPLVTGALPNQNIVSTLAGIAVLYLTLQIPKWLQQAALLSMRDAGTSVMSVVSSTVQTTVMATRAVLAAA